MIIDYFLFLTYSVVNIFFGLFPSASLTDSVATSVATASSYLSSISMIVPMTTLIAIIGLVMTIEGVMLTIKIINWFIRKIPSIS